MTGLGLLFLLYYGAKTLKTCFKAADPNLKTKHQFLNRRQIILLALSFSLLNPHAIIDSLVLIGGGSAQFPGHKSAFLLGVISSSLVWFTVLTAVTYYFAHVLTREKIWRRIEFASGALLIYLSFSLLRTLFN
jgi:L-lysine exporter family protein LysE/ArgO